MNNDRLDAALDAIGRSGAQHLEVGYLNEDAPTSEQADWYATAQWRGTKITAEHHTGPAEAAEALVRKVLDGGTCVHCANTISLTAGHRGLCRWTRQGNRWTRGCTDTHPEGQRQPQVVQAYLDTYAPQPNRGA